MTKLEAWYDLLATKVFDRLRDPLLLVLRLFIGWQFYVTGRGKLEHIDRIVDFFTNLGIPAPALNAHFIAWLETVGGVLLFIGLASRLIALPLSIAMIVAFATADHDALSKMFTEPDGFTAAAPFPFLIVSLIVLAFGPGRFSVDWLIRRMRRKPIS
ncbi:MAG: putative oxidoreductase [Acidobacteriota bacterium]|jgi:putative oxidoreductase|nr:putative oxidoreductase [Acidobacteriota bacterium]